MSEENKRCPFCGNKDIDTSPIFGFVWCYDCHSVSDGVDRWNTRPLEDALQARIDALEAEAGIRDWECLSCGWTYRGKDQCPKCGDTAHPLTTAREIAQKARIAALEAVLDEIRLIARSVLPSEEVISDHQAHWNGNELYQIAKKAESALEGEAQK